MPSFVIVGTLILILSISSEAAPTYLHHECPNSTTYSSNSTFKSNLGLLLSSLSSNSTAKNGFYNSTSGQNTVNAVYGLFLCRGDVSTTVCQDCVTTATTDVLHHCPNQMQSLIWYEECFLRYSNLYFFSVVAEEPSEVFSADKNITEDDRFKQLLGNTVNEIVKEAAYGSSDKKFAAMAENFTSSIKLYVVGQCTLDLSAYDCNYCLGVISSYVIGCCSRLQGTIFLFPSCNIRYELFPFYNLSATSPTTTILVPTPTGPMPNQGKKKLSSLTIAVIVTSIVASLMLLAVGYYLISRRVKKNDNNIQEQSVQNELPTVKSFQFDLGTIGVATNNFSEYNKLGEGGFGKVYKGTMPDGLEIAVKRLSRSFNQGVDEFKHEVEMVVKLQHRNLVRLLGYCLQGDEMILVYEYVPNKSLDCFLFDMKKSAELDWSKRYKIIGDIARGILYLHEDSRLRVVHRDIKASNILLDFDMNAKISDFGMARTLGVEQIQGTTNRIVGTCGYMSPEYAMYGQFSVKSDVYSFGILILEIISGKKNISLYQSDVGDDLISYVWENWQNETLLELMDPTLKDSYSRNEVTRCIHIALLCLHENPSERPTMASILVMLNRNSATPRSPRQPASLLRSRTDAHMINKGLKYDQPTRKSLQLSVNEASITELYPR